MALFDYLPKPVRDWVEDRAAIKRLEAEVAMPSREYVQPGPVSRAERHLAALTQAASEGAALGRAEPTYTLQPGYASEYDAGLRGQRNFSDRITSVREEGPVVPIHRPTETTAYKMEHAYYAKHFPSVSQEQRDAARLSSAPQDQAQLSFRPMEERSRDQGMER